MLIPTLKRNNFNKWEREFTSGEIMRIKPILAPLTEQLGYARPSEW